MAGIRALLLLLRWRRGLSAHGVVLDLYPTSYWLPPVARQLMPHARVRQLELQAECSVLRQLVSSRLSAYSYYDERVVAWSEVLQAYGIGLKAIDTFYGRKRFSCGGGSTREAFHGLERFPEWAVRDVRALPPLHALAGALLEEEVLLEGWRF